MIRNLESLRAHLRYLHENPSGSEGWVKVAVPLLDEFAAQREQGWLIGWHLDQEIDGVRRPTWVGGLREFRHTNWTTVEPIPTHDSVSAIRFARKQDAEAVVQAITEPWRGLLRIEEHIWDSGTTPIQLRSDVTKRESGE